MHSREKRLHAFAPVSSLLRPREITNKALLDSSLITTYQLQINQWLSSFLQFEWDRGATLRLGGTISALILGGGAQDTFSY